MAVNLKDRTEAIKGKYSKVPYLNSSLFEISELEDQAIRINSLDNEGQLELINTTILKETKKKAASLPSLDYLFKFLDAYDFASEGTEDVQEDNKTLITASVLGKVFEKINGYKDGSIFTPAFITMYMCKQSIRLAVVEKFNEALSENEQNKFDRFEDVKNYTTSLFKTQEVLKANEIINSLRFCDPAVGSGHFLVSSLNEIICIKAELGILADEGKKINGYEIEIVNDELIITNQQGSIAEYKMQNGKPLNKEIQLLQKTLFHEKQTIIENCLFGVDINPNSVKICRLRLWIELLKNAYYKEDTNFLELETLPNIDINIKCGNSLLSRFPLDADLSKALKSIKYDIKAYRGFVNDYKNEKSRDVKRGLQKIIDGIKGDFKTEIIKTGKDFQNYYKAKGAFEKLTQQFSFFEMTPKEKKKWNEDVKSASEKMKKYEAVLDEIKNNVIYKNAFEWRFEFPEVLNNKGEFEGFDLIIGNPPYIKEDVNKEAFNGLRNLECYQGKMDIWYLFGDLGLKLLKPNCNLCYIATNNWVTNAGASNFRNILINKSQIVNLTDFGAFMIFENASIQTMIMLFKNTAEIDNYTFDYRRLEGDKRTIEDVLDLLAGIEKEHLNYLEPQIIKEELNNKTLTFNSDENAELLNKIKAKHNFTIRDEEDKKLNIKTEFGNGIDVMQDFISKASAEKMKGKAKVGDGVFVLSQQEYESKNFSTKEKEILKPYYTTKQLNKYYGNPDNTHWVVYTKSDINKPDKKTKKIPINNYPKIKQHLDYFAPIITSAFAPYGLNRAREQYLFEGVKILAQRKCPKEPTFTYTEFDCFVSRAFVVIQSERINLKYLTGLLNSKLVAFWLRKKGKMQGNAYQLDKEPLLEIPIYKPTDTAANKIAALVDKIIAQKEQGKNSKDNETKIDELVYKLYDLTAEEILVVENSISK